MPRRVIFVPEARAEFEEAVAHYEEREPGLGDRFEAEVDATFRRILANPELFRLVGPTVRKAKVFIFPYNITFTSIPASLASFPYSTASAALRNCCGE
jgi:plasmid stabilization system protein ParE